MKKLIVCTALLMSFFLMNTTALMATNTLQVSTNGRFIVAENETPFLPQNDWAFQLPWKLNDTDTESYIQQRAAQGFNMITMYSVYGYEEVTPTWDLVNQNGDAPFTVGSNGKWDPLQPIDAYWNYIGDVIDTAAAEGMYVNLMPMPGWLVQWDDAHRIFDRDFTNCYYFGNWIGQFYADKTNLIWSIGGGGIPDRYGDYTPMYNAMAKGIADGVNGITSNLNGTTDYSTTLMTFDSTRWTHSSSYWFQDEEWLDFNSIHEVPGGTTPAGTFYQIQEIEGDYNLSPTKPTWLLGAVFENQKTYFQAWQSRFQVYQTLFAGGFGISYGNQDVTYFNDGWDTNMNSTAALQMKFVSALLNSSSTNYQFLARIPDQSLIVGDTGSISGSGYYYDYSDIIQATRTENGKYAMIYCANGRDITVSMSQLANGTMSAKWYNPRTGDWTVISNDLPSGLGTDDVLFDTPGDPSDYGNDWVLVLDLVAGPTPIDPIVDITNQVAAVTYDVTEYTIGGTNNENVVGTMIWSNQLTVAGGSFPAASSWTIEDITLNVGANVIKVTGENSIGDITSDSITITRGVPGTGTPVLDITNDDVTVVYNTTEYNLGFTINTNVVGMVHWINPLSGMDDYVDASAGIIESIALAVGSNVISVAGTNVYGQKSTDVVTITRTASLATPIIDITTGNINVSFEITQLDVSGTADNIVGTMNWANQLTGGSGNIPAMNNWTIPNMALNVGGNIITVSGTNVYGDIADANITVTRLHESKITLRVSDNKRFIVNTDGTPFCPQNDWATKLVWKLDSSDALSYIQQRKAQKFNMITMYSVDITNTDSAATFDMVNYNGYAPFVNVNDKWDPMQPVSEYWNHIGDVIDTAAANGMYVNLMPLPARFVGLNEANRIFAQGDITNCYKYGYWIGQLYADKTNLIWSIGGGLQPDYYYDYIPQFNAMAKGIADGVNGVTNNLDGITDYSSTLMTYDSARWTDSSSAWFNNEEWLDFNSIHEVPGGITPGGTFYQILEIEDDYGKTPVKPTWLLGSVSEYQKTYFLEWQSRFQVYQTVFAGGFGISYGNKNVEGFNDGWETNMNSEGALQMQYVTDLMTSVSNSQFLTRIPDQSLIDGDTGEITQGVSSSLWYMSESTIIQATRTENRNNAMIYSANGRNISVNMDQLAIAGALMTAEWYNPRVGDYTYIDEVLSGPGAPIFEFDPPGAEAEGNDWVLVLNGVPEPSLLLGGLLIGLALLRRK